jgi:hypothetical protein
MKALAITAAFLVTILVAFLAIAGLGMGGTLPVKSEKAALAPANADEADAPANSRKYVPGYFPTREEAGLPPAKPCEGCKNKHRK